MSETRSGLKLVPDPTLALHPTALALRQLADQIDQATRAGYLGHDAVEQAPVRDRAAVAVALGFGEAAVAVALQDLATTMRGIEPVLRRGVEAHEREVAGRVATLEAGTHQPEPYTEAPTSPGPQAPPKPGAFAVVLAAALTEPYRTVLASLTALLLGAILSWLGVHAGEGQPASTEAPAPIETPAPAPAPVPRDPVLVPSSYRDPEPAP